MRVAGGLALVRTTDDDEEEEEEPGVGAGVDEVEPEQALMAIARHTQDTVFIGPSPGESLRQRRRCSITA
jgi:hypothetical protein